MERVQTPEAKGLVQKAGMGLIFLLNAIE